MQDILQKDYGNTIPCQQKRFVSSATALLFCSILGWGVPSGVNSGIALSEPGGTADTACSSDAGIVLRNTPEKGLSPEAVHSILKSKGLFDARRNPSGAGIPHKYETQNDGMVVYDHAGGLAWQQTGSVKDINYQDAKIYVSMLNKDRFAGYDDWRLPTLEEAISLVEPANKGGNLHTNPLFDPRQTRIWTSDGRKEGTAWVVWFDAGFCDYAYTDGNVKYYVRAVRTRP
ncbi:MAG: DUF1566 domain-containing protein [Planctomycetota bacterium]